MVEKAGERCHHGRGSSCILCCSLSLTFRHYNHWRGYEDTGKFVNNGVGREIKHRGESWRKCCYQGKGVGEGGPLVSDVLT